MLPTNRAESTRACEKSLFLWTWNILYNRYKKNGYSRFIPKYIPEHTINNTNMHPLSGIPIRNIIVIHENTTRDNNKVLTFIARMWLHNDMWSAVFTQWRNTQTKPIRGGKKNNNIIKYPLDRPSRPQPGEWAGHGEKQIRYKHK